MTTQVQPSRIKSLYRKVAKRVHPDFASDQEDRATREQVMAEVNLARERGNAARLRKILREYEPIQPEPNKARPSKELPRGLRMRGNSYVAFLTHPDGHGERRTVGNVTRKMAIQQRQIWQRELAEGRYIKKVPRIERVTFAAIADKALERSKRYKRSWGTDAGCITRMKTWWGSSFADEITTQMIDDKLYENVAPRGECWTETTSNEYKICLQKVFSLAIERGEIAVNPAAKAYRYKLDNERKRELSNDEETRLRAAIANNYADKEPEFSLMLHTGMRRSNLYGIHSKDRREMPPLDWSAVNLDWKVITLTRSKPGPGYIVPLNAVALDALKALRKRSDGTGPVVRKSSGREIHSCRKWFEACVEKAGISDFRYHDLRHTFGSRLRSNGVRIEDIAALLGHSIPEFRMSLRYAHVDLDRLHQAVATLVPKTENSTDTKTDTSAVLSFPVANAS